MERVEFSSRAARDMRRISKAEVRRIMDAVEALAVDERSLDIKALRGRAPWLRMRVGDYRLLYRPISRDESHGVGYLIARVVHRRDLERAVGSLE